MTLKELWFVSPQNFVFVVGGENAAEYVGEKEMPGITRTEYVGERFGEKMIVERIIAASYPMYKNVIEVVCKEEKR